MHINIVWPDSNHPERTLDETIELLKKQNIEVIQINPCKWVTWDGVSYVTMAVLYGYIPLVP